MRLLVAVPEPAIETPLLGRFARADAGTVVVRRCVDLADLLAAATSGVPADVVVVSSALRHLDRDAVAALHGRGLRVVVVAVGQTASDDPERPLSRPWGADHVVAADPEQVLQALRATGPEVGAWSGSGVPGADAGSGGLGGRLVAVWGPTGAPGRTTVATTLADESARRGVSTLLADADTYGASVAMRLGLLDDLSGLAAACRQASGGRLTADQLLRAATNVDGGLLVLTGLARPERWAELRPAALDEVWLAARQAVALTVVDCGFGLERSLTAQFDPTVPDRDGAGVATLAAADTVLGVGRLDPVGLVRLLRDLPTVRDVAPTAELVVVLVGSGRRRGQAADADDARRLLEQRVGVADVVVVPDDRASVEAAHWAGRTLAEAAPGSPARVVLADLAGRLAGLPPRSARRQRVRR